MLQPFHYFISLVYLIEPNQQLCTSSFWSWVRLTSLVRTQRYPICVYIYMLHSQIRTPWNSNNDQDPSMWIGEQPCTQTDLRQFSRNAYICIIPGKLSENHPHAWLLYNPRGQVPKSIKSRGQICPILLRRKRTFPRGLENNHACKWAYSASLQNPLFVNPLFWMANHVNKK